MAIVTQPAQTDLLLPLPGGQAWDPLTIHTHYFGLSIPEAGLGAFLYLRCQPAFRLSQGGVCLFQGMNNVAFGDMEFLDFRVTMPWPQIDGNVVTTANGLRIEFIEPGRSARVSFTSADGQTSIDVIQEAVTPLLARGHVMPGEERDTDPALGPGGSEQYMRCTGELTLHGERYAVDCYALRDRSWRQVRREDPASGMPPVGCTPMRFGSDLAFNQVGYEAPDTEPAWSGLYDVPPDRPSHHFGWVYAGGAVRELESVRRNVLERHPQLFAATRQEIDAEDDHGAVYRFSGQAIAMAAIPAWPNVTFRDSLFRWEDEKGRIAHASYQEIWSSAFQRQMRRRSRSLV